MRRNFSVVKLLDSDGIQEMVGDLDEVHVSLDQQVYAVCRSVRFGVWRGNISVSFNGVSVARCYSVERR